MSSLEPQTFSASITSTTTTTTTATTTTKTSYKKLVTHVEPQASAVSLLKRAENSAI